MSQGHGCLLGVATPFYQVTLIKNDNISLTITSCDRKIRYTTPNYEKCAQLFTIPFLSKLLVVHLHMKNRILLVEVFQFYWFRIRRLAQSF